MRSSLSANSAAVSFGLSPLKMVMWSSPSVHTCSLDASAIRRSRRESSVGAASLGYAPRLRRSAATMRRWPAITGLRLMLYSSYSARCSATQATAASTLVSPPDRRGSAWIVRLPQHLQRCLDLLRAGHPVARSRRPLHHRRRFRAAAMSATSGPAAARCARSAGQRLEGVTFLGLVCVPIVRAAHTGQRVAKAHLGNVGIDASTATTGSGRICADRAAASR